MSREYILMPVTACAGHAANRLLWNRWQDDAAGLDTELLQSVSAFRGARRASAGDGCSSFKVYGIVRTRRRDAADTQMDGGEGPRRDLRRCNQHTGGERHSIVWPASRGAPASLAGFDGRGRNGGVG